MPNYEDCKEARENINRNFEAACNLSVEKLVAVDVAQSIRDAKLTIKQAEQRLEWLEKAAKKLPTITLQELNISPDAINKAKYKFRGQREYVDKLYSGGE